MTIFDTLMVTFISFGSILLSIVFIIRNHRHPHNIIATILSFSVAIWIVAAYLSDLPSLQTQALFLNRFLLTAVMNVVVSMFFLAYYFPIPSKNNRWLNISIIILSLIISILTIITPLTISTIKFESWGTDPKYGWLYNVFSLYLSILIIIATTKFIHTYRHVKGLSKLQMKYLFFGIFLFMFINLLVHTLLAHLVGSAKYYRFGNYSAILFVIFLAIAIIKHRLMDIRLIIARTVGYIIIIILFSTVYVASAYSFQQIFFHTQANNQQYLTSTIITLFLLFSFQPIRQLINKITNNIFYHNSYDTTKLINTISELTRNNIRLTPLIRPILDVLSQTLQLETIQIVILHQNYLISKYSPFPLINSPSPSTLHNLNSLLTNNSVVIFDELEASSAKDFLRLHNIGAIIPLKTNVASYGFLLLGEKQSGQAYTSQDINVLDILTDQLSIAVQNALSYEEISRFNDTLKAEVDKATADLQRANRHLKHLDKLKDEFVFIATHELKNPVTAMRGYLSMLKEGIYGPIPANIQEPLDQLIASNQQLVDLVNDLLQIARSEAQTITIHTKPLILPPIIQSVIQSLMPLAIQKHLNLTYSAFPQSLPEVLADDQRVKEILNNLISNAIKYSDHGTITISHELRPDSVITHVKDEGVGISATDQKKLFTRFYRVEEEVAKGIPGTGLGLFIVKQLLEKMGGRIWVNSEKGVGSTFSFSLPIV